MIKEITLILKVWQKRQIGNFERALKKNDKGAQQVLDLFKGDEKKAKDYITQVVSDRNKERAFNNYKAMKDAVDSIQKGKPNVGAVDYVKRIIHNNNKNIQSLCIVQFVIKNLITTKIFIKI